MPSPSDPNLEDILVSDIVHGAGMPSLKHKLMQLSLYSYLERRVSPEWVEVEYPLKYVGPRDICPDIFEKPKKSRAKRRRRAREQEGGKEPVSEWPVDLAMTYTSDGRRVCEFIEVESINVSEFWERLGSINMKAKKLEEIYKNRHLNLILNDVDEVRFSVAINATGLGDRPRERLVRQFREKFAGVAGVQAYNIYVLEGNIYDFCPDDFNQKMLDNMEGGRSLKENWKAPLKEALASAYGNMRRLDARTLDRLYRTVPFYRK